MLFLVWLQILGGDLKMLTVANDSVLIDFDSGSVKIVWKFASSTKIQLMKKWNMMKKKEKKSTGPNNSTAGQMLVSAKK